MLYTRVRIPHNLNPPNSHYATRRMNSTIPHVTISNQNPNDYAPELDGEGVGADGAARLETVRG